mgnify:CR=1 FL=1
MAELPNLPDDDLNSNQQQQQPPESTELRNISLGLNQFSTKSVDREQALSLHGQLTNNERGATENDIKQCCNILRAQKSAVISWARAKVGEKIIQFAQKHKIPHPTDNSSVITNIQQLEKAWYQNEGLAEQVWMALFGEFDFLGNWEMKLESEFLQEFNWTYIGFTDKNGRHGRQKGCVAKIIHWQKCQFVKYINAATKRPGGHGKSVAITQPTELTEKNGKKQTFRRKPGVFYSWMVRTHDVKNGNDNKEICSEDDEQPLDDNKVSDKTSDV